MLYGYVRVSTDKQTTENQKIVISEWALSRQVKVDNWIQEIKSGTLDYEKRKLGELIKKVDPGDTIIVTEISRLGRSITMIFDILDKLIKKNVKVIAIKQNFELTNDITSTVIAFAFGLCAQIERQLISERTKAGLERARQEGSIIGRPRGKGGKRKLDEYKKEISAAVKNGCSILSLSKKYNVKWETMRNFCRINKIIRKI